MSGVLSRGVARGDWLLHRYGDETVGVHWVKDRGGGVLRGVDARQWSAVMVMRLADGTQVYSQACHATSDGYVYCDIPASAFAGSTWDRWTTGSWRVDATGPRGERRILGWGYWTLVV